MVTCKRKIIILLGISYLCFSSLTAKAYGSEFTTTALTGSTYTIFLYNTETGSTSIAFEEDFLFTVEAHEGVGLYLSFGSIFIAVYWAPNTQDKRDLFLLFNGLVFGDFIMGWGLSLPNYQLTNAFLFFGHAKI